ncbi:MAG: hypothetical protein GY711_06280 [bacterium]|nr:hypothetical protein [bacterium]
MRPAVLALGVLFSVVMLCCSGYAQCGDSFLEPTPGSLADQFGTGCSFAISGNTAVVGAPEDDTFVNDGGSLHVFERNGPGWVRTKVIYPNLPVSNYSLGRSVSICGDTVFAGTRINQDDGSVLVYVRQGLDWILVQELAAPIGPFGDAAFGFQIDLLADEAVVLAEGDERIYFFEYLSGSWVETGWLDHTVLQPYFFDPTLNLFARRIAVDHDHDLIAIAQARLAR